MFKQIRFILEPLFVGALIGVLAGGGAVLLLKLLPGTYTQRQETLAFAGFTLLFAFAGFVDTVKSFLAWLRFRKSQSNQGRSGPDSN
jgi:hypothetical protein